MQILQWLFKVADEPQHPKKAQTTNTTTTTSSHQHHHANHRKRANDPPSKTNNFLVVFYDCGGKWRLKRKASSASSKNLIKPFTILQRVDIGKAYFYDTLNLTRLGSSHCSADSMKMMKKEDIVRGLGIVSHKKELVVDGNKVLPINEITPSSSKSSKSDEERRSDRPPKGDRTKTISRMKELMRWAATAKSQKGGKYIARKVLQFRNKGSLKAVPDEDERSNESPKISFRWEVESCSTTRSSIHSAPSISTTTRISDHAINNIPSPLHSSTDRCTPRSGNWITTDSEFVVLEL